MAEPSGASAPPNAPTNNEDQAEPLAFTLQVVSPSVGVARPLTFSHLPATTTIKQLKARIRDMLPSKPTDESQRLIHRGRMLGRDSDTMLDVFGRDTLGNPESQTLHLVLRPTGGEGPSGSSSVNQHVTGAPPQSYPSFSNPLQPQPRPQSTPAPPIHGIPPQQALPGFQQMQQQQILHQAEHFHNAMIQRLQQLTREAQRVQQDARAVHQALAHGMQSGTGQTPAMAREGSPSQIPRVIQPQAPMPQVVQNLIAQQQRDRAMEGRQGVQDGAPVMPPSMGRATVSGRSSPILRPDHSTTYTREGVGSNGERWQVTVNETTTTLPTGRMGHSHHHHQPTGNHAADNTHVLQNAERYLHNQIPDMMAQIEARARAARGMEPGTSTPASNSPQPNPTPVRDSSTPGRISTPVMVNSAHPPPGTLSPSLPQTLTTRTESMPASNIAAPLTAADPVVYILSSPSGPRALLVTNSDTFFTPRPSNNRRAASPAHDQAQARGAVRLPEFRNRHAGRGARRNARQERENPIGPVPALHANPQAGALAAQLGPMLWLVARLIGFVWFFTSGNPSWTRWLMISGMALVVFLINTGIFNGVANRFWEPIRRHLEALLPLAGPQAALVPAANAAVIPQAAPAPAGENEQHIQDRRRGELDPAQVAARLVEQHRQRNATWLFTQIRRVEHSLLLFLASLIPGVGERHIAAREAEANAAEAERQRQIEAANTAANQEGTENPGEQGQTEGSHNTAENSENMRDQPQDAQEPNLVEI